ncbi:MAG: tryptophan synthase subunit alpha [Candidatus Dormibacteria bacterium]
MAETSPLRIRQALVGGGQHPAVVPYLMAGFPRLRDTVGLLLAVQGAGAAAAELGLPYSDPLADGPVIQAAGQRALANGVTVKIGLAQVAEARAAGFGLPLVLMTYLNPLLRMGLMAFAESAVASGVDGVLVPDLPLEEMSGLREAAARFGLAVNTMVAPTTPDPRIRRAAELSTGFVYCVSRTGVTGSGSAETDEGRSLLLRARAQTDLPLALGFGVRRREQVLALSGLADAVVVGSLLLEKAGMATDPALAVAEAIAELRP